MVPTELEHLFAGGLEDLKKRRAQYWEKWFVSYEVAATQKSQLERQGRTGVEIRQPDHLVTHKTTHGTNTASIDQTTYGSNE